MKCLVAAVVLCLTGARVVADDYVVVVFDTSGSMGESMRSAGGQTRMKVAQDALVGVLTQVPPTTKVGVVTFEGWIYDLQAVERAKLEGCIRAARPGGGTPLYQFIKTGADRLLVEREKNLNVGSYKLLVVTDGEAQDNNLNADGKFRNGEFKPGYLRDVVSRGIIVDAIGLEMSGGHSLATHINGTYMAGNDPASIQKSLQRSVAEVGFGGKDGVGQEAFDTINQMPEGFAKASIKGLTDFQNHPIGELPPIKVVNPDGTVSMVPNPDNAPPGGGGMAWYWWVLIVLGIFAAVTVAVAVANRG